MYGDINRWAYFREKSTLCNNFIQKKGVGIFSRVNLFSEMTVLHCHSLAKEHPWVEYLTSSTKRGVSALPSVFCI